MRKRDLAAVFLCVMSAAALADSFWHDGGYTVSGAASGDATVSNNGEHATMNTDVWGSGDWCVYDAPNDTFICFDGATSNRVGEMEVTYVGGGKHTVAYFDNYENPVGTGTWQLN